MLLILIYYKPWTLMYPEGSLSPSASPLYPWKVISPLSSENDQEMGLDASGVGCILKIFLMIFKKESLNKETFF